MFPYILFVSLVVPCRRRAQRLPPIRDSGVHAGAAQPVGHLRRHLPVAHFDPPILALAWGVFIGGVAQLVLQIAPLARIGMLPRPGLQLARPGRASGAAARWGRRDRRIRRADSALINTQLAAWLGDGRSRGSRTRTG